MSSPPSGNRVDARTQPRYPRRGMQPLKAHVKNGRLTLDEPTDLPEGQVVYLQRIDGFDVIDRDGLDDDECHFVGVNQVDIRV